MFVEIPNENFEEELKQMREKNSGADGHYQQVPPPDMLYYYMVLRSTYRINNNLPVSTVRSYYSTSETLLSKHRAAEIQNIKNGRAATPPIQVEQGKGNNFIWRFNYGYSIINVTDIAAKQRPGFVSRTSGIDRVDDIGRSF